MSTKIYYPSTINLKESITADQINQDINTILLEKIKDKIGDKCHKEGFIKKDSITIIERTIGIIISSHFNGDIVYNLKLNVQICNPVQGNEILCRIKGKNNMGIIASNDILVIALTKLHHTDISLFENLQEQDVIKISVICSQYEYNDKNIQVIGQFISKESDPDNLIQ